MPPPYCAASGFGQPSSDYTAHSGEDSQMGVAAAAVARSLHNLRKDAPGEAFWSVPLGGQARQSGLTPADLNRLHQARSRRSPQPPFKFAGYLGTIVASLFASLSVLFIKLLPVENSIQEMAKASMYRGLFLALSCSAVVWYQGESFLGPPQEYVINFVRASMGSLSTLLVYVAIEFITMGECSALIFSSPVWTCILGFIILKEPLPISLFLAIPMSFLGIILLADPDLLVFIKDEFTASMELPANRTGLVPANVYSPYTNTTTRDSWRGSLEALTEVNYEQRLMGIVIALVASFFISGVIISFKYRNTTSIATCSFQYGAALAAVAAGTQAFFGFAPMPTSWTEWFLYLCIGIFSFGCQILFQWSLQFVPAGTFSVMRSLDIVLGFVLGAVFLNDLVRWTSVAGSILIMVMVVMLMLNDSLKEIIKSLCCCRP